MTGWFESPLCTSIGSFAIFSSTTELDPADVCHFFGSPAKRLGLDPGPRPRSVRDRAGFCEWNWILHVLVRSGSDDSDPCHGTLNSGEHALGAFEVNLYRSDTHHVNCIPSSQLCPIIQLYICGPKEYNNTFTFLVFAYFYLIFFFDDNVFLFDW